MSKTYAVKEVFLTLQGEGANTGRRAVFIRFSGCNLWSGRESDRATAICNFCDTDFVGTDGENGGRYTAVELAERASELCGTQNGQKFAVCTGGEPLLQLDEALIHALHEQEFAIAVETNGTLKAPDAIDWITVSPKSTAPLVQTTGNELKLVYPQQDAQPEQFENLIFDHFFLQPMDGPELEINTKRCLDYCLHNPKWKLSLQTHKLLGIP